MNRILDSKAQDSGFSYTKLFQIPESRFSQYMKYIIYIFEEGEFLYQKAQKQFRAPRTKMYYIVYKNYSSRPQETWKQCTTIKKLNSNNAAINTIFNSWLKVIFSL